MELSLSDRDSCTIDVASKLKEGWSRNLDVASIELEKIINDIHEDRGVELVEYMLDFDMIRSEVSFTSARLGNDNNSNRS